MVCNEVGLPVTEVHVAVCPSKAPSVNLFVLSKELPTIGQSAKLVLFATVQRRRSPVVELNHNSFTFPVVGVVV